MSVRAGLIKPPEVKMKGNRLGGMSQLAYPDDLAQYGFIMNFQEYTYRVNTDNPLKIDTKNSIILPLPEKLGQEYNASLKDEELNPIGQAISLATNAQVNEGAGEGFTGTIDAAINNSKKSALEMLGDMSTGGAQEGFAGLRGLQAAAKAAGKSISPDFIVSAVEAGAGNIFNPANITAFKGTPIRKHKLNWKLVPRSKSESETLSNIVKLIRRSMHSQLDGFGDGSSATSGAFFQRYPDIIQCALITPDINNSIFYKPALVSAFGVDHTGQGGLNFFQGTGSPVEYTLSLEINEIDFITRSDFEDVEETNDNTNKNRGYAGGRSFS